MSNRNFDNRVIIQRLQNQVYARNLYQNNTSGQKLINNPQNTDGNASRFNSFVPGAQTEYFRGLVGGGETISIGGTVNIPPFPIVPIVPITGPTITLNSVNITTRSDGQGGVISNTTISYTSNEVYSIVYLQRRLQINDPPLDNSGYSSFNILQGTNTLNLGDTYAGMVDWYFDLNVPSISFTSNIVRGVQTI